MSYTHGINCGMKRLLVAYFIFSVLTGCTTVQQNTSHWSDELPPRAYFENYYARDTEHQAVTSLNEYLLWIQRFYFGWEFYSRGWLQTTNELLETLTNEDEKQYARERSLLIAKLISAEWAKNKNYRVINTRHLVIWGEAVNRSIEKKEQIKILDRILVDVNDLLCEQIEPKMIADNRYYETPAFGDLQTF